MQKCDEIRIKVKTMFLHNAFLFDDVINMINGLFSHQITQILWNNSTRFRIFMFN